MDPRELWEVVGEGRRGGGEMFKDLVGDLRTRFEDSIPEEYK